MGKNGRNSDATDTKAPEISDAATLPTTGAEDTSFNTDELLSKVDVNLDEFRAWLEGGETVYESGGIVWSPDDGAIMGEISEVRVINHHQYGTGQYTVLRVSNAKSNKFDVKPGMSCTLALIPPNLRVTDGVSKAFNDPSAFKFNVELDLAKKKGERKTEDYKPCELRPNYYLFLCPDTDKKGQRVYTKTGTGHKVLNLNVVVKRRDSKTAEE